VEATAPVTVQQAAAALGVSASTLHRRIRSGALRAGQASRPQGTVWLVYLPPDLTVATGESPSPAAAEATALTTSAITIPVADALVSLIPTAIGAVLGPLVGQLDDRRSSVRPSGSEIWGARTASFGLRIVRWWPLQPRSARNRPHTVLQRAVTPAQAFLGHLRRGRRQRASAGDWSDGAAALTRKAADIRQV